MSNQSDHLMTPDPAVQASFRDLMDIGTGTETCLRQTIEQVLAHPGSLVRAQLAYRMQRAHGVCEEHALSVATAIEYFHTASLIFDDMPAMDNATERRGSPCAHVVFGEATATLAALAFINRGYGLLWQVIATLPDLARLEASRLVTTCLGVQGILNGHSRDLEFQASARGEAEVLEVAEGKTVTLIRLTLLLPAIVAGVSAADRAALEDLSTRWGLAYQIMDDFKDGLMTREETGKTSARDAQLHHPNLAVAIGRDAAWLRLCGLMDEARALVRTLVTGDTAWSVLNQLQAVLDREQVRIQVRLQAVA